MDLILINIKRKQVAIGFQLCKLKMQLYYENMSVVTL